jgi:hypothetical protein
LYLCFFRIGARATHGTRGATHSARRRTAHGARPAHGGQHAAAHGARRTAGGFLIIYLLLAARSTARPNSANIFIFVFGGTRRQRAAQGGQRPAHGSRRTAGGIFNNTFVVGS